MSYRPSKKRALRVLVLTYPTHIPPNDATADIAKKSEWKLEFNVLGALKRLGHEVHVVGVYDDLAVIRIEVETFKPDIVFNLLDEFDGTSTFDQNVVSYLELLKVPYTGCNPRGMILSRDKVLAKKVLKFHDINVPEYWEFPKQLAPEIPTKLPYPLFVKSLTEEASLGISQQSIVRNKKQLLNRIQFIHVTLETHALVETYIEGREFYVGILGNEKPTALPVWELKFFKTPKSIHRIATRHVKWDPKYQKKYGITSGRAKLPKVIMDKVTETALKAYKVLNLSGYARMDFRLSSTGQLYLLEANPNPHICHEEDMAESALASGVTYQNFIAKILAFGLKWNPTEIKSAA